MPIENLDFLAEDTYHFSIPLPVLVERPVIRNDQPEEWANKMTDAELVQFECDITEMLRRDPTRHPMSIYIDHSILYELFKMAKEHPNIEV